LQSQQKTSKLPLPLSIQAILAVIVRSRGGRSMANQANRVSAIGATSRILGLAALVCPIGFAARGADLLELGDVVFDPPFGETDGTVIAKVELLHPEDVEGLDLQVLFPDDRGRDDIRDVVILRDRGTGVDEEEGDGIFSGRGQFEFPVCGVLRLRVKDFDTEMVSPTFELPSRGAFLATAAYTPTFVVEAAVDEPETFGIPVDQGLAGQINLTLNSAARWGRSDFVEVAVDLDGVPIDLVGQSGLPDRLEDINDCVERLIEVKETSEEFTITTEATGNGDGDGELLAVRIDAVVDTLELRAIQQPSISGDRPLRAEAFVSALGIPVPGAEVLFRLAGGDSVKQLNSTTDGDGVAVASFPAEAVSPSAVLTADVVNRIDPILYVVNGIDEEAAQIDVVFEEEALVSIAPLERRLALDEDDSSEVALTVQVDVAEDENFEITLDNCVWDGFDCSDEGLECLLSPNVLEGTGPSTFVVTQTLRANQPGFYTVFTDAFLGDHEDPDASTLLDVDVADHGSGGRPVIYAPSSDPAVIPAGESTSVVFDAVVAGTSSPPDELILEQRNEKTGEFEQQTERLLDNGEAPDEVAHDLVYSGTFEVESESDSRLIYRAVLPSDSGVHSSEYALEIVEDSGFPTELEPPDKSVEIVEEPGTGERFAADQLLVSFLPDVPPSRMLEIIAEQEESMIGFEPSLDVAQVSVSGRGTPEAVRGMAATFESYAEVEAAEPNHELILDGPYPNDPQFEDQDSLEITKAVTSWLAAGSVARRDRRDVAILDTGIDVDHPELDGVLVSKRDSERFSEECSGRGLQDEDGHGTALAGIVAAATNNEQEIAGASKEGKLLPIRITGSQNTFAAILCALGKVANNRHLARIINLSNGWRIQNLDESRRRTLERRILSLQDRDIGVLVVTSAGNEPDEVRFPASLGRQKGLVAVANTRNNDRPDQSTGRGRFVDLSAPGVGISNLQLKGGRRLSDSGSSYSAALVSGAASLMWSRHPNAEPRDVEQWLKNGSKALDVDDEVGVGRLDMAGAVLNGSLELEDEYRLENGPASWPSIRGTCDVVTDPAGGSDFHSPRDGRRFLSCRGPNGEAETEKTIEVPTDTKRLEFAAQIAAYADAGKAIDLLVRFEDAEGRRRDENVAAKIRDRRCDGFGSGRTRCTRWQEVNMTVRNPAEGAAKITFHAGHPEGEAVTLLVDQLEITNIKIK
jgi:hypothetical protein